MDEIKVDDYILAIPFDIQKKQCITCFYLAKVDRIEDDNAVHTPYYIFIINGEKAVCGPGIFTKRFKKITEAQYQYLLIMKEIPNELKYW